MRHEQLKRGPGPLSVEHYEVDACDVCPWIFVALGEARCGRTGRNVPSIAVVPDFCPLRTREIAIVRAP